MAFPSANGHALDHGGRFLLLISYLLILYFKSNSSRFNDSEIGAIDLALCFRPFTAFMCIVSAFT